jgi:hypothetical protein
MVSQPGIAEEYPIFQEISLLAILVGQPITIRITKNQTSSSSETSYLLDNFKGVNM